jgi:hypothetical protein
MTFSEALKPLKLRSFIREYWGKEVLISKRTRYGLCAQLPDRTDFEAMVATLTSPMDGWFSLVKGRAQPPPREAVNATGTLNLSAVYAAYKDGYTLLLTKLEARHGGMAAFCRALESELTMEGAYLRRPVGANAYLSPPSSQGFSIHYDDHDVCIVQLSGRKSWHIYRRYVDSPICPPTRPISEKEIGRPRWKVELTPGDLVYLPRGFAHEAKTGKSHSLHVTLSLHPVTWKDLITAIVADGPEFHRNIPIHFDHPSRESKTAHRQVRRLMDALHRRTLAGGIIRNGATDLLAQSGLLPGNALAEIDDADNVTGQCVVALSPGIYGRTETTKDAAVLHVPGASFRADRFMAPVYRYILKKRRFKVNELPIAVSPEEKSSFVRSLIREGVLVFAGPCYND